MSKIEDQLDLINLIKDRKIKTAIDHINYNYPLNISEPITGKTALMIAIEKSDKDVIKAILNRRDCDNSILTMVDNKLMSSIMYAIRMNDLETINEILIKLKYNLVYDLTKSLPESNIESAVLKMSRMDIDYNLEKIINSLSLNPESETSSRQDLLKDIADIQAAKSWGYHFEILGIDKAIEYSRSNNKPDSVKLLETPPSIIIEILPDKEVKKIYKRPTAKSKTLKRSRSPMRFDSDSDTESDIKKRKGEKDGREKRSKRTKKYTRKSVRSKKYKLAKKRSRKN